MFDNPNESFSFGGLEGRDGNYCIPPCDSQYIYELMQRFQLRGLPRILKAGLDPLDLKQAGWCVIWPKDTTDAVRSALSELLAWRRQQAGQLFRELEYHPNENLFEFLEAYDTGPDSVEPKKIPYYVLIVGGPEAIPFDIQVELAVSRPVGRISFENINSYAEYSEKVVNFEKRRQAPKSPKLTLFGVENSDDRPTRSARRDFVEPLGSMVRKRSLSWGVQSLLGSLASKAQLGNLLGGHQTPNILLTASHAVRYRSGSPKQATHQGALVCADWPGPKQWQGRAMLDEHLFSAADIPNKVDLAGLIAVLFACYSAGTPRIDAFANVEPAVLADTPFVSPLPRALLRHGALAVIGHVDLAFEHSFLWFRAGPQLEVFDSILYELKKGFPVGYAIRHLSHRHAQLAAHVAGAIRRASQQDNTDLIRDFHLWAAYVDARNYILLGDPAARINVPFRNQS